MTGKITTEQTDRAAIVYVRQSTYAQLNQNHESRRRQYDLVQHARQLGFARVETIDEDLGRSGSGLVERPGFQRLVAAVCAGEVGAIVCLEASRLARNGRDWHHLIELCGLVGTLLIDTEGIYDPRLSNDRLLLGLKGTMSEFELSLLRQRSLEALRSKAARGELQFGMPVGLCWSPDGKMEFDPDRRVQNAIRLVFKKFRELGSARQTLLWLRGEKIKLPALATTGRKEKVEWKLPIYNSVIRILTNPLYAGAYAFGKTETRVRVVAGQARKSQGHRKPMSRWTVLIRAHHPGYISWEEYERNQQILAENLNMNRPMGRNAARGGRSLLAGLLRCSRCGRMLHVTYSGTDHNVPRYHCRGANINHGGAMCLSFGGFRPDQAVAEEILRVLDTVAVEAALLAAERVAEQHEVRRRALQLEWEQRRYEADLAARRYEMMDPANRLVAAELEARWNQALQQMHEAEAVFRSCPEAPAPSLPDRAKLLALARDLPSVWNAPTADARLKQRILRILIQEIVADVDVDARETVLVIHWSGGRHSELRVPKNPTGRHQRSTDLQAVEIVRQMAGQYPDEQMAATLNRLGLRTGVGNTWHAGRIRSLRNGLHLPAYNPAHKDGRVLTMREAAHKLGVSALVIRHLIQEQVLPAKQIVACAPWQIAAEALESEAVQTRIKAIKAGQRISDARPSRALPLFATLESEKAAGFEKEHPKRKGSTR